MIDTTHRQEATEQAIRSAERSRILAALGDKRAVTRLTDEQREGFEEAFDAIEDYIRRAK